MYIRPIKTDADYRETLREIEPLMVAEAGTEAGDRIDVMVELVEAYERVHSGWLDQVLFIADAERFQQLTVLLDATLAPSEGLEKLMAVKAPWEARGTQADILQAVPQGARQLRAGAWDEMPAAGNEE